MKNIVGGGPKKVLYTLKTVQRIGLKNSAKALTAKNTCKACGLGMGGQRGGMTNELGEFPSVCNKSIQAQSTDIQAPIPTEVFEHSLDELRRLSNHELEHMGRLGNPVFKAKDSEKYQTVSWEWAFDYAAEKFAKTSADRSFFYSSGRSSNEAGFLLQLLSRLYGTNNVNNCSFYCHQATGVALSNSIGVGTATVELEDLSQCDLVFIIGANPASNHPRLIHQLKNCRERGGHVIVINPAKEAGLVKFAVPKSAKSMLIGGHEIASEYLQPKIGSDIAVLKGIAKAVLESTQHDQTFISQYTQGFDDFKADVETLSWSDIETQTGLLEADICRVANVYSQSKKAVFAWGMGVTHHLHGVENIEYISNLALLRGMIGKSYAGLLPLRGHSNVQGIGTIGVKPVLSADVLAKMETEFGITLPKTKGLDTLACLQKAAAGEMDTALIMGGNLYSASPDSNWAAHAMDTIGFKLFLTTTLNRGHLSGIDKNESLVLPVTARDEEWQPTTQESMFNHVRLSDGGIDRLDNVKPEVFILAELGKRLIKNSPVDFDIFKQHSHIRKAIARIIPDMLQLADIDVAKKEFHVQNRLIHTPEFKTADGKARFITHKSSTSKANTEFPFTLATIRSEGQFNTIIYEEEDSYRGVKTRWSVLMNSDDMQAHNIKQGDRISLHSPTGIMEAVQVYCFDLPRGNLMAYFPEANILTSQTVDPRSRTPNFKSIAVAISI